MPDLTHVATELYGLPPSEFSAARTAAVRAVRQAGDRDLARDIGTLRRPATAAAAVNLLVRHRPADIGRLLELGARLREAQAALAGADLRVLHAEQHRVMAEAVGKAIDLVSVTGRIGPAVRGQIEGTLRAAMGDPDAAAAVRTGLLTRDLVSSGFEPVDVAGAVAVPDAPPLVGVPARPTPLRSVPSPRQRARAAARDGDTEEPGQSGGSRGEVRMPGTGRRRRGRLLTSDEPGRRERPARPARPGQPARTGSAAVDGQRAEAGGAREASRDAAAPAPGQRDRGAGEASRAVSSEASHQAEREAVRSTEREAIRSAEREAIRSAEREAARHLAHEDVALAEQDAAARAADRDAADERLSTAETRIAELTGVIECTEQEIARLREVLATARQDARDEGLEVRHARSARTAATRAADRAEQRARATRDHRDRL